MSPSKREEQDQTLSGIIIGVDWDDEDSPIAVALSNDSGEEYFIAEGGRGEELLDYVDEEVEVVGRVTVHDDGGKEIEVNDFWSKEAIEEVEGG